MIGSIYVVIEKTLIKNVDPGPLSAVHRRDRTIRGAVFFRSSLLPRATLLG